MAKVLCIEDEDLLREDIVEELTEAGFETFQAADGRAGYAAIVEHSPDLVLCDLMMPDMPGLKLLEILRQDSAHSATPFIFLTALAGKEHILAGKRMGADEYMTKPVDFELLIETVRSRLSSHARAVAKGYRQTNDNSLPYTSLVDTVDPALLVDPESGLPNQHYLHNFLVRNLPHVNDRESLMLMLVDVSQLSTKRTAGTRIESSKIKRVLGEQIKTTVKRFFDCSDDTNEVAAIAHLQDNTFGIAIQGVDDRVAVEVVAREITKALTLPGETDDLKDMFVASWIGVYDAADPNIMAPQAMERARAALNNAKTTSDTQVMFYDETRAARDDMESELTKEIPRGIRDNEFELHYQPRFSFANGTVTSIEALVRWNHPIQGLIPPNDFIPAAERSGMVTTLGEWVLRIACKQAKAWLSDGYLDIIVAVNISTRNFSERSFVAKVAEILRETGLPAANLEIEITESTFIQDSERAAENVRSLKELGVTVALDDFGTGYANLTYLKMLRTNTLKIDREFVENILDDSFDCAIAQSIINLGGMREMHTIAEGVEEPEQVRRLLEIGCKEFQGYFFSRPKPSAQIPKLIQDLKLRFGNNEEDDERTRSPYRKTSL